MYDYKSSITVYLINESNISYEPHEPKGGYCKTYATPLKKEYKLEINKPIWNLK